MAFQHFQLDNSLAVSTLNDSDGGNICVVDVGKMSFRKLKECFSIFNIIRIATPVDWREKKSARPITDEEKLQATNGCKKWFKWRTNWNSFINKVHFHNFKIILTNFQFLVGDEAATKRSIKLFLEDVAEKCDFLDFENMRNVFEVIGIVPGQETENPYVMDFNLADEQIQLLKGPEGEKIKYRSKKLRHRTQQKMYWYEKMNCWDLWNQVRKLIKKMELVEAKWENIRNTNINCLSTIVPFHRIQVLQNMTFNWDLTTPLNGTLVSVVVDPELLNGTITEKTIQRLKETEHEFVRKLKSDESAKPDLKRKFAESSVGDYLKPKQAGRSLNTLSNVPPPTLPSITVFSRLPGSVIYQPNSNF